jgi:hypothetical protein
MRRIYAMGVSASLLLQVATVWAGPAPARERGTAVAPAVDVTIAGRAQVVRGQVAPKVMQLRSLETGRLVATTTSDADGAFSFANRRPGSYSVELVNGPGAIVATSAAIVAPAGTTATVTVASTRAAAAVNASTGTPAAAVASRPAPAVDSTASIVSSTAAAAGIPGMVGGRHDPSPSF